MLRKVRHHIGCSLARAISYPVKEDKFCQAFYYLRPAGSPAAGLAVVGSVARPLGDVDMVPLGAALAGHAHAVWVAVLPASAAGHPLPIEVLHHQSTFRTKSLAQAHTHLPLLKVA